MYLLLSFPSFVPGLLDDSASSLRKKMEKKGRTDDVEIFKTVKPDFLQIQATELPKIKMAIIGHIILKVVYKYLRPEE